MPLSTTLVTGDLKETGGGVSECLKATGDDARGDLDLNPLFVITRLFSTQVGDRIGMPPTLSGCPRLILANTPLTTSTTQPIITRTRSIRSMLLVFSEDIQKGVGGIPIVTVIFGLCHV